MQCHSKPIQCALTADCLARMNKHRFTVAIPFSAEQMGASRLNTQLLHAQNRFQFSVMGHGLRHAFYLQMSLCCREKPNTRVEALNLNDSQRLTRPGPRLFSPALRAFLARQNNHVLRRSAMLRPLTLFEAGCLSPPFGRLGVNRALGSRDNNIWR